jgi:hypothetical protein
MRQITPIHQLKAVSVSSSAVKSTNSNQTPIDINQFLHWVVQWAINDLVTFQHQLREIARKVVWKYYELRPIDDLGYSQHQLNGVNEGG